MQPGVRAFVCVGLPIHLFTTENQFSPTPYQSYIILLVPLQFNTICVQLRHNHPISSLLLIISR